LYSIVQMPRGIPVATVAIGNAANAGLLAVRILGAGGATASPPTSTGSSTQRIDSAAELEERSNAVEIASYEGGVSESLLTRMER